MGWICPGCGAYVEQSGHVCPAIDYYGELEIGAMPAEPYEAELPLCIIEMEAHGETVWGEPTMDALRRDHCLCLNCGWLDDCAAAQALFDVCKEHGMALAVTRCREWEPEQS